MRIFKLREKTEENRKKRTRYGKKRTSYGKKRKSTGKNGPVTGKNGRVREKTEEYGKKMTIFCLHSDALLWIHVRIRRKGRIRADSEGKIGINLREKTEENGKKRKRTG